MIIVYHNRQEDSLCFISYPAYCFYSAYEVNIMAAITHGQHSDFHWTAANLSFAILLGVVATAALWFFAGLLIVLFLSVL